MNWNIGDEAQWRGIRVSIIRVGRRYVLIEGTIGPFQYRTKLMKWIDPGSLTVLDEKHPTG